MQKDFKDWNPIKQSVHNERPRIFFKEREVWFSYFGENVGFEQDGRGEEFLPPVIVLKKINLVDAKRLKYKMGTMTQEDFIALKEKTRRLIA